MTPLALAATVALAQSGWTSTVVFDAPAETPVRTVALTLDPDTGDRLFVLDVGQTGDCGALADWSPSVAVAPAQGRNPHPQLRVDAAGTAYVAYVTTAAGTPTIGVASRCADAPSFVDSGAIDTRGAQGFGVDTAGVVENHEHLTSSSMVVDEDAGALRLAWVRRDAGRSVAVEGRLDLPTCE